MKKNGFTVMEMTIYMGLLATFVVILSQIFSSTLDLQLETEATSSTTHDGRFLILRLSHDIHRAQTITVPDNVGVQTSSLQLNIGGDTHTYTLNSGNLQLTNSSGTNRLNSYGTTVSNFTVQRLGNSGGKNTVRFGFTLTSTAERKSGPDVKNFQTTIGLR